MLESRREALESLNALVRQGRAERITSAGGLAKEAGELPQVFETWQTWWRDLLLLAHNQAPRVTNVDYMPALEEQAGRFSDEDIHKALTATRAAARQLAQNVNARLVTEVLALHLPQG